MERARKLLSLQEDGSPFNRGCTQTNFAAMSGKGVSGSKEQREVGCDRNKKTGVYKIKEIGLDTIDLADDAFKGRLHIDGPVRRLDKGKQKMFEDNEEDPQMEHGPNSSGVNESSTGRRGLLEGQQLIKIKTLSLWCHLGRKLLGWKQQLGPIKTLVTNVLTLTIPKLKSLVILSPASLAKASKQLRGQGV